MGPKPYSPASGELFQLVFTDLINLEHPLVKLATLIDWEVCRGLIKLDTLIG